MHVPRGHIVHIRFILDRLHIFSPVTVITNQILPIGYEANIATLFLMPLFALTGAIYLIKNVFEVSILENTIPKYFSLIAACVQLIHIALVWYTQVLF